jgi:hypothetical protein
MKEALLQAFVVILAIAMYIALPIGIAISWVRWFTRRQPESIASRLSLGGLTLATLSAFVALGSIVYAHLIGGFPFYDPRLLRIYRWGSLLALGGLLLGIGGCWKRNPLRWQAPLCAFGVLVFWLVSANGE